MSTLKADTIQNTSGGAVTLTKQSAAKAWINFNGTGTVAIRSSSGVTSISDNGTGEYTVNFTNSFSAAEYSATLLSSSGNGVRYSFASTVDAGFVSGSHRHINYGDNGGLYDQVYVTGTFHGDLA